MARSFPRSALAVGLIAVLLGSGCLGTAPATPTAAPKAAAPAAPAAPTAAPAQAAQAPAAKPEKPQPAAAAASPVAAASDYPTGPVKISFWIHQLPTMEPFIKEMAAEYEQKHPNVKIELSMFPSADLYPKLLVAMTGGTGPNVFSVGDWLMDTYRSRNMLAPIPPVNLGYKSLDDMKNAHVTGVLDGGISDGQIYGYPMYAYAYSLFVNKAHFKDAGLDVTKDAPKTWNDAVEVAKKLTKFDSSGRMTRQGFGEPYFANFWTMIEFSYLTRQMGGEILGASGQADPNNEAPIKALKLWGDMVNVYKVTDPAQNVATALLPNEDFVRGNVSMWPSAPWTVPTLKANQEIWDNFAVVPLPQVDPAKPVNTLYGFTWVINAKGTPDQQKVSADWIRFAADHSKGWLERVGVTQTTKTFFDLPEVKAFPYIEVFKADMATGKWMLRSPEFNPIADAIHRAVQRTGLNKVDARESWAQAATEINQALKR
ncbi:MAG: extracellular solute-binding protein [Chloroflexi bacterium]|nr:extracellular solute-binding protein [Chloroflexota bacterium]